ncbi:MAG: PAS domain S-box protein, partial [Thermoplasmata archaeon]|nr:PAS domain S-box protein [Thermoplasmata archaeon]
MIRVLIVDDEPEMLRIAKIFVERDNRFTVETAGSTSAADALRSTNDFDCLVVDYQMPEEGGIEYLMRLRAANDKIAFILFTGHGREDVAVDALNNGADFYLRKGGEPKVKFAELRNMIYTAVIRNRAIGEAARLALTVAASPDAIISTDLKGMIKTWNPGAERIYGAKAADIIGKSASVLFPKDKLDEFTSIQEQLVNGRVLGPIETERRRADGSKVFVSATYFPLKDITGTVIGGSGHIRDITRQRIAEERLKSSEEEFKTLVQSSPCIICRLSASGETLFANDYIKKVTGYEPSFVAGKNWWDLFYPGPLREQVDAILPQIERGDIEGVEMVLQDSRGVHRTLLWTSFNRYSEDGRLKEVNGIGLDITRTRVAEEGLRESGLFNRAVLDSLQAHIAVVDRGGRIVAVNDAWEQFGRKNSDGKAGRYGYGANYIEATRHAVAAGATGAKEALDGIQGVLAGKLSTFSMEYMCDTPEQNLWFVMRVTPLSKRRGGVVVSHRDITESKTLEQALRMSEQRYRTIFETTGTAMAMLAQDSTVLLMNAELERISGYSKLEVEGRMSWQIFVAPKDLPRIADYNARRRADPASAPRSYEFDAIAKDGAVKHMLATADLIPGTSNTLVSLLDVTERKANEEMVRVANKKLSMLGSMTRHDIYNQLTVIYGSLEQAAAHPDGAKRYDALKRANEAGQKIQRLLEFARDYQNAGTNEPIWADLQATILRAAEPFRGMGLDVVSTVGAYHVHADQMIEKVFYNLIDNSV